MYGGSVSNSRLKEVSEERAVQRAVFYAPWWTPSGYGDLSGKGWGNNDTHLTFPLPPPNRSTQIKARDQVQLLTLSTKMIWAQVEKGRECYLEGQAEDIQDINIKEITYK